MFISFERESVSVPAHGRGRGREREGERESQADSVLSTQSPTWGSNPQTVRSWPAWKPRVEHLTNWATQVPLVDANLKWESIIEKVLSPFITDGAYYQTIFYIFDNGHKYWHDGTYLHLLLTLFHSCLWVASLFVFTCRALNHSRGDINWPSLQRPSGHSHKFSKLKMDF